MSEEVKAERPLMITLLKNHPNSLEEAKKQANAHIGMIVSEFDAGKFVPTRFEYVGPKNVDWWGGDWLKYDAFVFDCYGKYC